MAQWEAKSTGTNANRFACYDQDPGGDWGDSNWDESGNWDEEGNGGNWGEGEWGANGNGNGGEWGAKNATNSTTSGGSHNINNSLSMTSTSSNTTPAKLSCIANLSPASGIVSTVSTSGGKTFSPASLGGNSSVVKWTPGGSATSSATSSSGGEGGGSGNSGKSSSTAGASATLDWKFKRNAGTGSSLNGSPPVDAVSAALIANGGSVPGKSTPGINGGVGEISTAQYANKGGNGNKGSGKGDGSGNSSGTSDPNHPNNDSAASRNISAASANSTNSNSILDTAKAFGAAIGSIAEKVGITSPITSAPGSPPGSDRDTKQSTDGNAADNGTGTADGSGNTGKGNGKKGKGFDATRMHFPALGSEMEWDLIDEDGWVKLELEEKKRLSYAEKLKKKAAESGN